MTETRTLKNFVGGEYVDASNGRTYDLVNPATGQTFAQAPISEQEDIDRAFEAAQRAFETWRDTTPSERQLALLRLADAIEERAEELVGPNQRTPENRSGSPWRRKSRPGWTRSAFSPAPPEFWKASPPESTSKGTRRSSAASQ